MNFVRIHFTSKNATLNSWTQKGTWRTGTFLKKKVFNYSGLHFCEVNSYKIHTLAVYLNVRTSLESWSSYTSWGIRVNFLLMLNIHEEKIEMIYWLIFDGKKVVVTYIVVSSKTWPSSFRALRWLLSRL